MREQPDATENPRTAQEPPPSGATVPPCGTTRAPAGTRVLFVLWDGGGNVSTSLLFVRDLIARGATVTVLGNPSVKDRTEAAGAAFREFRRSPVHDPRTPEGDLLKIGEATSPAEAARLIRDRVMYGPAAEMCQDVIEAAGDTGARIVVADYVLPGALVAAERLGLPQVVFMNAIYPMAAGASPHELVRNGPFVPLFERMVKDALPALNEVRARWGLAPLSAATDQYDRADRCMVATFPTADPAADRVPERVRYVGAGFAPPGGRPDDRGGPRRVLVSLSTTLHSAQPRLVRSLLEAAEGVDAEFHFLGGVVPDGRLPGNVRASGYRPIEELLPDSSVLVTLGGHGTFVRGLAFGVPMLVAPFEQDAFNNARRAVQLGVGRQIRLDATAPALRKELELLLTDGTYRSAANDVARRLHREHRPEAAARLIAELLD
ncbi:glycosyltransferase [Streptomyces sp. NRRL S-350]|uniref:glycosyltransferase n=1 Tax=Streptomyces sp. NRRL S-350 TaxID=1463902 RepID=UPI00131E5160|nr:glycosyltransferase [Streptomyces sp. NRRL S-350]